MPNSWKTYKLSKVTTKIGSGSTPRGGQEAYKTSGTSLIRSQNILDFTFSTNGLAFIDDVQASKLNNVTLEEDDVLLNITGDSVARVCQVPIELLPARVNQHVAIIRANKEILNPSFLKYLLLETTNKNSLLNMASAGATRQAITKSMIEGFEIKLPPLQEQQPIASILSAIDDKIENNLAINKTLEEMAMAFYKHWFMDFGPFQDGEFVESEMGMIPKGWEVKKIGDVIETLGGGTPSTTVKEYWHEGDVPWYSPTDLTRENSLFSVDTAKKITSLGLQKSSAKMFPTNSLLMSSRATVGLLTINTKEACTNQGFITMIPNDQLSIYQLYFWIKQSMDLIISKCNGSTFKEISKSNFRDLDIIVADNIAKYIEESRDIFEKIKNNITENQSLIQLRDTLLPQLISGTVRLKEFRETVEEVL